VPTVWRFVLTVWTFQAALAAQSFSAPAGIRPAFRRLGAAVLPGGRVLSPLGDQYVTGPGAFGLKVGPTGKSVVTVNSGPGKNSLTVLEQDKAGRWQARQLVARSLDMLDSFDAVDWRGVFMGVAFSNDHAIYASEGNSGKISLFDWSNGHRRAIDLNQKGFDDSYSGDLALDPERGILYVVDQANFRVAVIDTKTRTVLTSVRVGRLPFAVALSPDRQKLYVTNLGTFQYQVIPGVNTADALNTALSFPAFGFPSPESANGAERSNGKGTFAVPGLGDPNANESNSVCVLDVSSPASAKVETFVHTGLPFGGEVRGGSSPSGILATSNSVFVANAHNDLISILDPKTNAVTGEIPIRIPGLESLRGVLPLGMAYDEKSGWLLVAEAGINAVAVIDTREKRVLGHLPVGSFPTAVAIDHDMVFVANAKAFGPGPSAIGGTRVSAFLGQLDQGSVSVFGLPQREGLPAHTTVVMEANGFRPSVAPVSPLPDSVKHVVLIVKESRSYDQVFGDIANASNGPALGRPDLAHLGSHGYLDGKGKRFSLKDVSITPNQHEIARRWAFSDNFYADADFSVDGHHWLTGVYPNAWTLSSLFAFNSEQKKEFRVGEAPGRLSFPGSDASVHPEEYGEAGTIWDHLTRHNISFYNFGEGFELAGTLEGRGYEPSGARYLTNVPMPDALFRNTSRTYPGFNMDISDQARASEFIRDMEEKYGKSGSEMPRFVFVHLPGDYMAKQRPDEGYPYEESFVADNDYAVGRIVEYLSGTKWWGETAVFITEDDAQGGLDHVDAHRTLLLCASPWCKKDYVSHTNTSFPGLLKTIFRLLKMPPLNLFDAAASDLTDFFTSRPDATPWKKVEVDKRIFDPAAVRQK